MGTVKDDEEYWNSNEKNFFCFENNEKDSILGVSKSGTALLRAGIASISTSENYLRSDESQWNLLKPLSAIIHEKTLACILEADKQQKSAEDPVEKPEVTVKKILLGQPYSLEQYKSLTSKTALLDATIASGNGNATLGIILFLTKTLKKSLVQSLLMNRPEANQIYLHYLSTRMQTPEMVELLKMQGRNLDAAMSNLHIIIKNTSNIEKLLKKLRFCYETLFVDLPDCKETAYLHSYIQLLEWQVAIKDLPFTEPFVPHSSLLECLRHTCRDYWNSSEALLSPVTLLRQYQISLRQYQTVAVSIRASAQEWDDIDNLLHTKNWLGSRKFQASLPIEDILKILHENGASNAVLEKYLNYVDNTKKRLEIAMSLKCHKSVIDILGNQGDRIMLQEYKSRLQNGEHEIYAAGVLKSPAIKWKN